MPIDLKGYTVFIASPGGLDKERNTFRDTIEEHNKCDGIARSVQFIPVGWEETIGGQRRPQSIINDEVRKCDYFIMVLYDRWGTPPGQDDNKKYSSGTEEEYNIALECLNSDSAKFPMRQIIIFFKAVDARRLSDPGEQLNKVLEFRKKLESERTNLFHPYDTVNSFEKWLRKYLAQWVRDHEGGKTAKIKNPVEPYDENIAKIKEMSMLETLVKPSESPEEDIKKLIKKADKLADEGEITEAEITYSEAVVRSNSPAAINAYGNFLMRLGRLGQAEIMYEQVMEIATNIDNEELESVALGNLGLIYQTRGELNKAEDMHKKALEINERLGRLEGMANDYNNLGVIYRTRGELNKAEDMHKKSLAINEKLGRLGGIANSYGNLGLVYRHCNEFGKAEDMFNKVLEIEKKLGRLGSIANSYGNLGTIYAIRNELDKAEDMFNKVLEIEKKLSRPDSIANAYGSLGLVYHMRGELDKAEETFKKALEINERLGCLEGMAGNYNNLGVIYETRGELKKAKEFWVKSRDLYKRIGMPNEEKQVQGLIDSAEGGGK